MAIFSVLSGFKTYLAASGLVGLAVHHFASGMMSPGHQSPLSGTAAGAPPMTVARLES